MIKKIRTTDTDLRVSTSTAMIVKVGIFKFVQEEEYPWIDVFITGDESDTHIEQIYDERVTSVIDIKDLEVFAVNWVFENVKIVKRINEPEILVQKPRNDMLLKALQNSLNELNQICDECTSYWIHDGVLWCGEDEDGKKGKVCDVNAIENFTVYADGCIRLEGEELNENWLLRTYGPEY